MKAEGVDPSCKLPGVHDPLEPEYSILKQRLARRIRYEKMDVKDLDLPSLTNLAERTITDVSEARPMRGVLSQGGKFSHGCGT